MERKVGKKRGWKENQKPGMTAGIEERGKREIRGENERADEGREEGKQWER